MLRALSIRDFVIVDTLELEFHAGFTVLSGETGAGKSILVDALSMVLGGRADSMVVREGTQRAEISAEFDATKSSRDWLLEQGIDFAETLLLRRVVDASGRSKAWINGTAVTLSQLRELAETLVDIHGQHAHQALLKPGAQRTLIDEYAGIGEETRKLAQRMLAWRKAIERRERAGRDDATLALERERLAWQLDDLERLNPQPGEWQAIQAEHQRLAHAAALIEAATGAINQLSEADDALLPRLAPLLQRLVQLQSHDARLAPVLDALEPARIQLQEAVYSLQHYLEHIDLDPLRLSEVETRLEALHSTARKLRFLPDALAEERARLSQELKALTLESDVESVLNDERSAEAAYRELAQEIRVQRERAATQLGESVTKALQTLSMEGGRFEVLIEPTEPSASGTEQVEFMIAAHPGVEPRPLARVASGGELARISLAISVIASTAGTTPTLIFDEVDAGIGGAVAEVVGRLLRQLGAHRQVLSVTHLPQVAAQAEQHYMVSKSSSASATVSQVTALDDRARVEEVARMLGGIEITATTRKHARELLASSGAL